MSVEQEINLLIYNRHTASVHVLMNMRTEVTRSIILYAVLSLLRNASRTIYLGSMLGQQDRTEDGELEPVRVRSRRAHRKETKNGNVYVGLNVTETRERARQKRQQYRLIES